MYKIGIVGLGYWGAKYVTIVQNHAQCVLTAICCLTQNTLDKYANIECAKYLDYQEMLSRESLDGVIIATLAYIHKDVIIIAMSYNVPVLVEKPYCMSLEECTEINIRNMCGDAKIMVANTYMYNANVTKLIQIVQNLEANEVNYITFEWASTYDIHPTSTLVHELFVHPLSILLKMFPNCELKIENYSKNQKCTTAFVTITINSTILVNICISSDTLGKKREIVVSCKHVKIIYDDTNQVTPIMRYYPAYPSSDKMEEQDVKFDKATQLYCLPCTNCSQRSPLETMYSTWIQSLDDMDVDYYHGIMFSESMVRICEQLLCLQ